MIRSSVRAESPERRFHVHLLQRQWKGALAYLVLLLLALAGQAPVPFLISGVIDSLTLGASLPDVAPQIAAIVGLSLVALAASTVGQIAGADLHRRFILDARMAVFEALQHAPASFLRRFNVSDLQARLTADLGAINHLSPAGLASAARHVACVLVYGVMLIRLSPAVVAGIAWLLPLAALVFRLTSKRQGVLANEAHSSAALGNATMLEALVGLRESRVTGSHAFHRTRLHASLAASEVRFFDARRYGALMFGALSIIPIIVTALIWTVGAWQISTGKLTVGELVSFIFMLSLLYAPINGLFGVAAGYVFEWAAFERVANLFDGTAGAPERLPAARRQQALPSAQGAGPAALALRAVSFGYGDEPILDAIDIDVPTGRCTLLAGPNGCGKSTLAAIVCGLESPSSGAVLVDGIPIDAMPAADLARRIGYLPQQALILGDSLRLNITLGRDISDEQIRAAGDELGLSSFLDGWDSGLNTVILEGGRDLSGGQKQKIALLRAVVHRPVLLVLDEPENNLDQATLTHLVRYLGRLKGRCTVLAVSHGPALHGIADRVVEVPAHARRQSSVDAANTNSTTVNILGQGRPSMA